MIKIGGHVSSAGGPLKALERAQALHFPVIQIHPTAPQSWASPTIPDQVARDYQHKAPLFGVEATYFHNVYLINLASTDTQLVAKSIQISKDYMVLAAKMGVKGVITHLGSHKGLGFQAVLPSLITNLKQILDSSPTTTNFIIENTAGAGGTIGRTLEELEQITEHLLPHYPNLSLCFDTCHSFASGIPLHTPEGQDQFFQAINIKFGLERLSCFHLNDCVGVFGDSKDRHANLLDGNFSAAGFSSLFKRPEVQSIPFIMEVPGVQKTGPDSENLNRALSLSNPQSAASSVTP